MSMMRSRFMQQQPLAYQDGLNVEPTLSVPTELLIRRAANERSKDTVNDAINKNNGRTQQENIADGRSIVRPFDISHKLEHTRWRSWMQLLNRTTLTEKKDIQEVPSSDGCQVIGDWWTEQTLCTEPPAAWSTQTDWLGHLISSSSLRCLSGIYGWCVSNRLR